MNTPKHDPQFLTVLQSAQAIGVHPNTIRNMISKGDLPALRFGPRAVRIDRDTLLKTLTPYRAGEFGQWKTR